MERGRADGTDHKLLESDRCVGVRTPVDDVHHRHGQRLGVRSADIAVERHPKVVGRTAGCGERHAQDGVGAQLRFGRRAVQFDHGAVDADLIGDVHADDGRSDDVVYIFDGFLHALAQVASLVAVAQLGGFVFAGRGAAGNGCATEGA